MRHGTVDELHELGGERVIGSGVHLFADLVEG